MTLTGQITDIFSRRIFPGEITIENGIITSIKELDNAPSHHIIPGFIDAHVHIESSMVVPSRFAEMAVKHGTVATVSDPHEIANVLGVEGVRYMIRNGKEVPFKFFFGAPSCVPATSFETSGYTINAAETETLMNDPDIWYLGEMMNFPGVIFNDEEVHAKIKAARKAGKPVDGHAPLLSGEQLGLYAAAGISTDHECTSLQEAEAKIRLDMKILIREGSAARDFEMLFPLIDRYPSSVMFCTDDCHPDELLKGHINIRVRRALEKGCNVFNVLKAACVNPVIHYNLPVGLLREGDPADFIVVDNLSSMNVQQTWIAGNKVMENGQPLFKVNEVPQVNHFTRQIIHQVSLKAEGASIRVIVARDGELLTEEAVLTPSVLEGFAISDPQRDLLKMVVASRYDNNPPAIGFIQGIGLKKGALACSIAHDSHNVIAVGTDDECILKAINKVIESRGGLAAFDGSNMLHLSLPVAGLMSDQSGETVANDYQKLNRMAADMGSLLRAPFMTLAFMSLLVIPKLKLGDRGLFDGSKFEFTNVFVD